MEPQSLPEKDHTELSRTARFSALILYFAAMVTDGFDLAVMPLTMPAIAREWRLPDTQLFGAIFSAGILGIMVGAPLLGSIADRLGRKRTFIFSLFFFGLCSLSVIYVNTVTQLFLARFGTGFGIGGALSLGIVSSAELVRPTLRTRVIAIVSTGATAGVALAGFAASWLLPLAGWRSLFIMGAVAPIMVGVLAIFVLPESITRTDARSDIPIESAVKTEARKRAFELFSGSLAYMTPLLWLLFIVVGLTNYFIQSWVPTLYSAEGYLMADVALALGLFGGFGAVGGLLIGWPVDRFGVRAVTFLFILAIPVLAILASSHPSRAVLMALMAAAGLLLYSLQVAINGIATQLYPAGMRAKGVGWGLGSVRMGQLLGASGGGLLIGTGMGMGPLFWLLTSLAIVGALASIPLGRCFAERYASGD